MSSQVSIGVIGVGRIGRMHVKNLISHVPEARVLAVADIFEDAARKVAAENHIPDAYGDPRYIFVPAPIPMPHLSSRPRRQASTSSARSPWT